jgi:hypothetical protein
VIEKQQNHGADDRHEHTVEVESAYAGLTKEAEEPPAGKSANNTQEDVEDDPLTSPIYNLATDISGNQTENDPSQE